MPNGKAAERPHNANAIVMGDLRTKLVPFHSEISSDCLGSVILKPRPQNSLVATAT
jgi:hypothetical protein